MRHVKLGSGGEYLQYQNDLHHMRVISKAYDSQNNITKTLQDTSSLLMPQGIIVRSDYGTESQNAKLMGQNYSQDFKTLKTLQNQPYYNNQFENYKSFIDKHNESRMKTKIKNIEAKNNVLFQRLTKIQYGNENPLIMQKRSRSVQRKSNNPLFTNSSRTINTNYDTKEGGSLNFVIRKKNVEAINQENLMMFKRLHEIKPTYSMNKILGHTNHIGEIGKNMKFYDDHGIRRMDPLIIRDLQIRRSSRNRSRISNNLSSLNVTTKENTQTLEPDNSEFSKSTLITLPQENSGSALEQIINNTNFTSKKEQTSYNQFQSKDLTPKNFINIYQGSNNLSAIDQLASNLNLISHKAHQQNQTFNNSQFNNHTVRSGSTMRTRNAENIAKNHSTNRNYENINQKVTYPVLSSHFSTRNNYSSSRNNIGSYWLNIFQFVLSIFFFTELQQCILKICNIFILQQHKNEHKQWWCD